MWQQPTQSFTLRSAGFGDMGFLASLAAAVAPGLVSGLFGRSKPKAQGVDYQKLVNDATAAGFNPLTALRNGGSQAYTREPVLSSTSFIGEALGKGLQTAFNHKEQEAEARKEKLEIEIMEAQLERIQNSNKSVGGEYFGFNIPSASQTTGVSHARGSSGVRSSNGHDNSPKSPYVDWTGKQPIPSHIPVKTRDGQIQYIANPDLPDIDQIPIAEGIGLTSHIEGAIDDVAGSGWKLPKLSSVLDSAVEAWEGAKPSRKPTRPRSRPKRSQTPYNPRLNPPLRGYYGKPGRVTGF